MITAAYCQTMARYNAWQNNGLIDMVHEMDEGALRLDRGAFFGSIMKTLNHLLWGDQLWMSLFDGGEGPSCAVVQHVDLTATPGDWTALRVATDTRIATWAAGLSEENLSGDLKWFSGAANRDMAASKAMCITHFFNHQTHHRGQIHAMLTAAGQKPQDTDLFFMPEH